jgi:hypothetical protein
MRALFRVAIAAALFALAGRAEAQVHSPVDLPIPNIMQETDVWCWAAVAQQIIHAVRGPQATPAQCQLVAMSSGVHPGICCGNRLQCRRTGALAEIANLIGQFSGRPSSYERPADAMALYRTLQSRRAVILHIRSGQTTSHVVVLRGMSFVQTAQGAQPVLHINDPLSYYTQPVLFSQLAPIWIDAIVVN